MSNSSEKSTILMTNIESHPGRDDFRKVTVDDLVSIFLPFGELEKVIIFSKKTCLKAFVEFVDVECAVLACNFVHKSQINDFGFARTFFSPMQKLQLSNNFLEFKDFQQPKRVSVNLNQINTKICLLENRKTADTEHPSESMGTKDRTTIESGVLSERRMFNNSKRLTQPFKQTNVDKKLSLCMNDSIKTPERFFKAIENTFGRKSENEKPKKS